MFFLLTYLGRKSIAISSTRGAVVIDAILKTLATLLTSMRSTTINEQNHYNNIIGNKIDFQLISWLLLFLSVCLDDGIDKKDQGKVYK